MNFFIVGVCASLVSAASWALSIVLYRRLEEKLTPFGLNLTRGILSIPLLAFIAWLVGRLHCPDPTTVLLLGVSGLLGIALGDSFFFLALRCLGARLTSLLGTLSPLVITLLSIVFLGERPTRYDFLGIALTLTGIVWVLWEQNRPRENKIDHFWRGAGYGFLSILCMSISVVLAKSSMAKISAVDATLIRITAGVLGLFIWGLTRQSLIPALRPLFVPSILKELSMIVLVSTLGGFLLFMVSLKYTDASIASTLNCTTPLFVLPFAAIFFKERISPKIFLGVMMAVFGSALIIAL